MLEKILRNARTVIQHPSYLSQFGIYQWRRRNGSATIRLPWGDDIGGFVSFSEYCSAPHCLGDDEINFLSRFAGLVKLRQVGDHPATVLDVGANIGVTGLYFSHLFPLHKVICFEPSPSTYKSLTANMARNRRVNVHCEPLAVCDHVGEVQFAPEPTSRANAHIAYSDASRGCDAIRVPATTLDSYAAANGVERITLLKVDTEGHEHAVLLGAQRLLSTHAVDVVYFEFCPNLEVAAGSEVGAAVRLLVSYGYASFAIAINGNLEPFDLAKQPAPALCNLVAVAPARIGEFASVFSLRTHHAGNVARSVVSL